MSIELNFFQINAKKLFFVLLTRAFLDFLEQQRNVFDFEIKQNYKIKIESVLLKTPKFIFKLYMIKNAQRTSTRSLSMYRKLHFAEKKT